MIDTVCRVCMRKCKSIDGLASHFSKVHIISCKDYYDRFFRTGEEGLCTNSLCKEKTNFSGLNFGYNRYCSKGCNLKDKNARSKTREMLSNKYGVESINQLEVVKERKKKTCLDKYGVENPSQLKEVQERKEETNLKNRGVRFPMQSEQVKEKRDQKVLKKYGVENIMKLEENREKQREFMLDGGAIYANSCVKNPSKPQVSIFRMSFILLPSPILNYPVYRGKGKRHYSIDIADSRLFIAIEYDGSRYHQNKEEDDKRQKELEEEGWVFLRYRDRIPTLEQLKKDIEKVVCL